MRALFVLCGVALFTGAGVWYTGVFQPGEPMPEVGINLVAPVVSKHANEEQPIDQALRLIHAASDKMIDVRDYRCTFLRDEVIEGNMQQNHIKLAVRHEPFSVFMEWVGPKPKKGRQVIYVDGENNGKMLVKQLVVLRMDPEKSIEMKESRHKITEAGLKKTIERFAKGWEREKDQKKVEITLQDVELSVKLGDRDIVRPCRCVTTRHKAEDRELFTFYHANVYFDKETGLPMRMEGYDWPKTADDKDGQLSERFTYVEMELNVGLTNKDFSF